MVTSRGRIDPWRRRPNASHLGRRGLAGLAAALSVALLTACPSLPPPERLAFDTDLRILRGSFLGTVDTRAAPYAMAVAGDASLLVASWSESLEFWDPETSQLIATMATPSDRGSAVSGLSVDRSGAIVAGILDGTVLLWDGHDGRRVLEFDPGDRLGACLYCGAFVTALHPAGDLLAVGGGAPGVLLVDTATGAVVRELAMAGEYTGLVAFGADGALLAHAAWVSDTEYALRVWETASYGVVFEHEGTFDPTLVPSFAFAADGERLAVGMDTRVELYDLNGGEAVLRLDESVPMWHVALSPDGTQVALASDSLTIIDLASGSTLAFFPDRIRGRLAWSTDGRYVVAGPMLVRATDFGVFRDHTTGQLHGLGLDATPEYVDASMYAVAGSLSIDGGDDIEFSGIVKGNESQSFVPSQARPPTSASLEIELHGHPWRLYASQTGSDEWWGVVRDSTLDEDHAWVPLRLWRAP
jgi:hypothetical protein